MAGRILELSAFEFQDIAVLVRNTEVIPEFTAAFDAAGIPYVVNRGRGFYDSREVNDLTHLLRVIVNPRDEISLAVVLRSPLVNASEEALLRLKMNGDSLGSTLARTDLTAFGAEDQARLSRFSARSANGGSAVSTSLSTAYCSPPSTIAVTPTRPIWTNSWRRLATPRRACRWMNLSPSFRWCARKIRASPTPLLKIRPTR